MSSGFWLSVWASSNNFARPNNVLSSRTYKLNPTEGIPKISPNLLASNKILTPFKLPCHCPLSDNHPCIKFSQLWLSTPHLGVCEQLKPSLISQVFQEQLKALFPKIPYFNHFPLTTLRFRNFSRLGGGEVVVLAFLALGFTGLLAEGPCLGVERGVGSGVLWVLFLAIAFLLTLSLEVEIMGGPCSVTGFGALRLGCSQPRNQGPQSQRDPVCTRWIWWYFVMLF